MEGEVKVGNQVTIKVIKNKVAPPFREAKLDILYGIGFDELGEVIDIATNLEILDKSGSWYSYKGIVLCSSLRPSLLSEI